MSKTTAPKTATKKVAETTPVPVAPATPVTPVTPAKEKKVKAPAAVVAAEPVVDHAEVDAEAVLVKPRTLPFSPRVCRYFLRKRSSKNGLASTHP